jgi:hypothetical protein
MTTNYLNTKPIQRSKGHSTLAASSYITGQELQDYKRNKTENYHRKDVVHHELVLPDEITHKTPEELWNSIERYEDEHAQKPDKARTGRRFVLALPKELSFEENRKITKQWIRDNFTIRNIPAEFAIHDPRQIDDPGEFLTQESQENIHSHVQISERRLTEDGWSQSKVRKLTKASYLDKLKKDFASKANKVLEDRNLKQQVNFNRSDYLPNRVSLYETTNEQRACLHNQAVTRIEEIHEKYGEQAVNKKHVALLKCSLKEQRIAEINQQLLEQQQQLAFEHTKLDKEPTTIPIGPTGGGAGIAINEFGEDPNFVSLDLEDLDQAQQKKAQMIRERVGIDSSRWVDQVQYVSEEGTIVLAKDVTLTNYENKVTVRGDFSREHIEAMVDLSQQRFGDTIEIWGTEEFKKMFTEVAKEKGVEKIIDQDMDETLFGPETDVTEKDDEWIQQSFNSERER